MPREYHTLYTLGYSGWTPEQVAHAVTSRGAMLFDIRFAPWSKSPQWQQGSLARLLGANYRHVKALGNVNYKGDGPITIADPAAGVAAVERVLAERPVVLMCGCRDYWTCHRDDAADLVAQHLGLGLTEHLSPPRGPATTAPPPALTGATFARATVDWVAVRERCDRQQFQAAYAAAGLSRDADDYREAAAYIETRKAEALEALMAAWRERKR